MSTTPEVCSVRLDDETRTVVRGLRPVQELLAELGLDHQKDALGQQQADGIRAIADGADVVVAEGDEYVRLQLLRYTASNKHKATPTRGIKGNICPPNVDGQALLERSETHPSRPGKRFATDGRHCYAAHQDARGGWHGWPCARQQVPEQVWRRWVKDGVLRRSAAH
jgi:hypothetical protein